MQSDLFAMDLKDVNTDVVKIDNSKLMNIESCEFDRISTEKEYLKPSFANSEKDGTADILTETPVIEQHKKIVLENLEECVLSSIDVQYLDINSDVNRRGKRTSLITRFQLLSENDPNAVENYYVNVTNSEKFQVDSKDALTDALSLKYRNTASVSSDNCLHAEFKVKDQQKLTKIYTDDDLRIAVKVLELQHEEKFLMNKKENIDSENSILNAIYSVFESQKYVVELVSDIILKEFMCHEATKISLVNLENVNRSIGEKLKSENDKLTIFGTKFKNLGAIYKNAKLQLELAEKRELELKRELKNKMKEIDAVETLYNKLKLDLERKLMHAKTDLGCKVTENSSQAEVLKAMLYHAHSKIAKLEKEFELEKAEQKKLDLNYKHLLGSLRLK